MNETEGLLYKCAVCQTHICWLFGVNIRQGTNTDCSHAERLSWYVLPKQLCVNQKCLLCRRAVCKTHICWLFGVNVCQGVNTDCLHADRLSWNVLVKLLHVNHVVYV